MNIRRILFRVWIGLSVVYAVIGTIGSFEDIVLRFRLGANHPWLHLSLALTMLVGVPLVGLGLGRMAFWATDLLRSDRMRQCEPH